MFRRLSLFLLLLLLFALPAGPALARALSAADILAAVNQLRAAHGLKPYRVDPGLMAYAQEHSEYQARMDRSDHLHSDGLLPQAHGLVENVAGGTVNYIDANTIVYEIWADAGHLKTMTGYASGWMGVGVASNAETTYITLDVRPGDRPAANTPGASGAAATLPAAATAIPYVPLATVTARPDGALVHPVGYGQTLWNIALAYGVHVSDLRRLNGLPEGSTAIYAGQLLVIRPAATGLPVTSTLPPASPSPTVPPLAPAALASATPALLARQPAQTGQPAVTRSSPEPSAPAAPLVTAPAARPPLHVSPRMAGLALILLSAALLVLVWVKGFRD